MDTHRSDIRVHTNRERMILRSGIELELVFPAKMLHVKEYSSSVMGLILGIPEGYD